MTLEQNINAQIKDAMKARQQARLRSLRAIKSAIMLEKTKTGAAEISDEAVSPILQKLAKQRRESLELYQQQGRDDLATEEKEDLDVITEFLPEQMGEEEVRKQLTAIVEKVGATGPQDMGKVMGAAMGALKGKADGKLISSIVKELLGS